MAVYNALSALDINFSAVRKTFDTLTRSQKLNLLNTLNNPLLCIQAKEKNELTERMKQLVNIIKPQKNQYSFGKNIVNKAILSDSYQKKVDEIAETFSKYITKLNLQNFVKQNIKSFF